MGVLLSFSTSTGSYCGILNCKEEATALPGPILTLKKIETLVVFSKSGDKFTTVVRLENYGQTLKLDTEGWNIEGNITAGKANLNIVFKEQKYCAGDFTCQVTGEDAFGRLLTENSNIHIQSKLKSTTIPKLSNLSIAVHRGFSRAEKELDRRMSIKTKLLLEKFGRLTETFASTMKDSEKSLDEQVWKLLGHLDVLIEKLKYPKKETKDTKKDDTDTDDSYDEELQFVISLLFVDLRAKTIPEMIESISNGTLNFAMEPANAVRNVSESLENDLNRTSEFLQSLGQRFRDFKAYDDQVVLSLKEEVENFREILGAGTNAKCSFNEASDSEKVSVDYSTTSDQNQVRPDLEV
ncbi:hypothetical protein EGW08_005605 [Elysia chlorotica]|uniref:Uncharacterized protein n=1 Tax=Elysia chlorotica TaxID=188477 RepID=A0A3S0ZZ70_ELYCH|nr:hypothetical protein EGW08_005605 [Elysia chlorotica]